MSRIVTVGAAQLGPIARDEPKREVVSRLVGLLHEAKEHGCDLVAFPELALTTFFPRWYFTSQDEIDAFFERQIPSPETAPLFKVARQLGIGFVRGFAVPSDADGATRSRCESVTRSTSGASKLTSPIDCCGCMPR